MARRRHFVLLLALTVVWLVWTLWFVVTGDRTFSLTVVDEAGAPVPGVEVSARGESVAITDSSGQATVQWRRGQAELLLEAPGFAPKRLRLDEAPDGPLRARIEATYLRGQVVDGEGRPVRDTLVEAGYGHAVTGPDGEFLVRLAEPGPARVRRPAWEAADFVWDGSPGERTVEMEPRLLRAVHVVGEVPADPARWGRMVALTETSELNAIMLDLKDDDGVVHYDTGVELAHRAGAVAVHYDLAALAREVADRGIYLIGRVVVFQDPITARALPDLAVRTAGDGGLFHKGGQYFLDPTDERARDYGLSLAAEACRLGVDEVQLDYVRYPDGFEGAVFDGGSDADSRVAAIESFLLEAKALLNPMGCALAADIFGFITTASDDGGIGQHWDVVTDVVDVASPMVYPSHYGTGWFGFEDPNAHPAEVVTRALADGLGRLDGGTVVRPWLQDFGYETAAVRAQIEAAEELGLGWMLWNAESNVSEAALEPGRVK